MKITSKYTLGFRRKRKGQTDYRKRLKILTSKKPRLVVRTSLGSIQASVVEFKETGDLVKSYAHSNQLKKMGWNYKTSNMPAAYLVGYLLGKRAQKQGVTEAVFDTGLQKAIKRGKLYAVLAGAIEAGLQIPHGEGVLPEENRLNGKHIEAYAATLKSDEAAMKKQFGEYMKSGANPEQMSAKVSELKSTIDKE